MGDAGVGKSALIGKYCMDNMEVVEPGEAIKAVAKAVAYYDNPRKWKSDIAEIVQLTIEDSEG